MPSGYTAIIGEEPGCSFEKFAWGCARAFGALVLMRDEPADAPIPQTLEPAPYYADALAKANAELARFRALTLAEATIAAAEDWKAACQRHEERTRKSNALRRDYESMLAKAKAWQPPTADHVGLRNFMVEQIENSIRFDCSDDYDDKPPEALDGKAWLERQTQSAARSVEYHAKAYREELERTQSRNAWLSALRASLAKAAP